MQESEGLRGDVQVTLTELQNKLAVDELVKRGAGMVNEKTYAEIFALCVPQYREPAFGPDLTVTGIRLIKNPFVPDGEIYPFDMRKRREYRLGDKSH